MNENLDLTEILKDCPKGMELDCTMFDNVCFERLYKNVEYPIEIRIGKTDFKHLTKEGCWNKYSNAKCVIFPKDKTTWEGFQRPFKDGDIAISDKGDIHLLRTSDSSYCAYRLRWKGISKFDSVITTSVKIVRLATEKEKQKLFNAIKSEGYKWNEETKTLEKLIVPKFKVGDRIKHRLTGDVYKVVFILSNECGGGVYDVLTTNEIGKSIDIEEQDNYELLPNKFDPKTLQPFDKVLVNSNGEWFCDFFSHYDDSVNQFNCTCTGGCPYDYCIPYNDDTKHLVGTDNEAPEYYRYWED